MEKDPFRHPKSLRKSNLGRQSGLLTTEPIEKEPIGSSIWLVNYRNCCNGTNRVANGIAFFTKNLRKEARHRKTLTLGARALDEINTCSYIDRVPIGERLF